MQIAIDQSIFSSGIAEEDEKILEASCQVKKSSNECAEAPEFGASTRTTPCQIDKVLLTSVRYISESGAGLLCICPKAFD